MRWQAFGHVELRRTAQLVDQSLACVLAVQQDDRILATCFLIGAEQGLELDALLTGTWVRISQCACGTHRGACTAAHTQIGVDLDLLA